MYIYILKLSAILAIFWLLYVLVLEREQMHRFKRFYLLFSVLAAVIIPLLSITEYVYVAPIEDVGYQLTDFTFPVIQETIIEETSFFTLERTLWLIYALGAIIFGLRFLKNLTTLLLTIKQNEKIKQWTYTYVLLKKTINPHTFFNYIFFNKSTFENKTLPKAVILHEETHAKQKHSIDVLFIELVQVIFWFHPLVYLYKRNIKLNHEFLADQAVLNNGIEASNYQNILLAFTANTEDYQLANAINYSSIKKRFTVMKTTTSKTTVWLKSLLVLPLLGVLFYSFSSREIIEIEETNEQQEHVDNVLTNETSDLEPLEDNNEKQKIILFVNAQDIYLNHQKISLDDFVTTFNNITNKWAEEDFNMYFLDIKTENTSDAFIKKINNEYRKTLLSKRLGRKTDFISTNNSNISPSFFEMTPSPKKPLEHIKAMKKENALFYYNNEKISANTAYHLISKKNGLKIKTTLNDPKPPIVNLINKSDKNFQEKATPKQIAAYNTWAKKVTNKNTQIKQADLKKYKHIYSIMTTEQKKNVEPFPNIPPPPVESKVIEIKNNSKAKKKSNDEPKVVKTEVQQQQQQPKSGPIEINGKDYYYLQSDGKTTLYSKYGNVVDIKSFLSSPEALKKAIEAHKEKTRKTTEVYSKASPEKATKNKTDCLEVPKSFLTKNNNTLNIKCINDFSKNKFQVYNRWGDIIYSKENYNNNWDGNVDESFAQKRSNKPTLALTFIYLHLLN